MDKWRDAFFKIVVGACIGFGASQMTVAGKVVEMGRDNMYLQQKVSELDTRTDNRISDLVRTINTTIDQNKDFIALLREQNSLYKQLMDRGMK